MTERKHLKHRIRERMARTGEAYATARAHTLRDAAPDHRDAAPDGLGAAPEGWFLAGLCPDDYEARTAPSERVAGHAVVLRATREAPREFGTLMQEFAAEDLRGRRVRWCAWVRAESVAGTCALWMRVDGPRRAVLAFDNMATRALAGTTPWTRCEVVLDVAPEAEVIAFGVLLRGAGAVWLDAPSLDAVAPTVPVTGRSLVPLPRAPRNLALTPRPSST